MRTETFGSVTLILGDCMEVMKGYENGEFSLAVTDPPYGSEGIERTGGTWANKIDGGARIKEWDFKPKKEYFKELFRVSENQIIWGGNYFDLPANRHFLIWQKHIPEKFTLAMVEYAWSSFNMNAKLFKIASNNQLDRFHPTQKPIALYDWIFKNYSKPGQTILDTHLGSGSSAIAALKAGLTFTGIEIDEEYFNGAVERVRAQYEAMTIGFARTKLNKVNPTLF